MQPFHPIVFSLAALVLEAKAQCGVRENATACESQGDCAWTSPGGPCSEAPPPAHTFPGQPEYNKTCSFTDSWEDGSYCQDIALPLSCTFSFSCPNNQNCYSDRCACNKGVMLKGNNCEIATFGSHVWAVGAMLNVITFSIAALQAYWGFKVIYSAHKFSPAARIPLFSVAAFGLSSIGFALARLMPVLLIFAAIDQNADTTTFWIFMLPAIVFLVFGLLVNAVGWSTVISASQQMRAKTDNDEKKFMRILKVLLAFSAIMFIALPSWGGPTWIMIFGSVDSLIIGGVFIWKGLALARLADKAFSKSAHASKANKSAGAHIAIFAVRTGVASFSYVVLSALAVIFEGTVGGGVILALGFALLSYILYINSTWHMQAGKKAKAKMAKKKNQVAAASVTSMAADSSAESTVSGTSKTSRATTSMRRDSTGVSTRNSTGVSTTSSTVSSTVASSAPASSAPASSAPLSSSAIPPTA